MSRFTITLGFVFIFGSAALSLYMLSTHTRAEFEPAPKAIGASTPVRVKISNPYGIRDLKAYVEQDGARTKVFETVNRSSRVMFYRKHDRPRTISFTASGKKEGKARLVVVVRSNDFRAQTDTVSTDVDVVLRPPSVVADAAPHYVNQGGSEVVVLTPSGVVTESGVRVGRYAFRSFPKPGNPNDRFALFAVPWDVKRNVAPVVFVRNAMGDEAESRFRCKVFPKDFRKRDIWLNTAFLRKAVNEIDPGGTGDLVTRFLRINGPMRRENNKKLADLRFKTEQRFLWSRPFLQLANSNVESQFADLRTYIYKGRRIDEQVHLGFDLSAREHVQVAAANDGKVVYADRLSVYGNCIVVDHGYGLQSIYGHLKTIGVKPGDMVKKGQEMGRSGQTGLAGGDYLHFSMQLDGVQINPVEWWDAHWIHDRVLSKIAAEDMTRSAVRAGLP